MAELYAKIRLEYGAIWLMNIQGLKLNGYESREMNESGGLKKIVLHLDGKSMTFQRVGPANSDELNELSELDKKDLIKIMVIDTSVSLIADKGAAQKLIHDLSNNDYIFSELADRSEQSHHSVQIYASNIWLRKFGLTPERYQELIREEDLIVEGYKKPKGK